MQKPREGAKTGVELNTDHDQGAGFKDRRISRRAAIRKALEITAGAALGGLLVSSDGAESSEVGSQSAPDPKIESLEKSSIPKMEFVKGKWFDLPKYPSGLDPNVIAEELDKAITEYFAGIKKERPDATSFNGPAHPKMLLLRTLEGIDSRFHEIPGLGDDQFLLDYVNAFLIRRNKYLFAELFMRREANIYDVRGYGEILFDDEEGGFYVELVNPVLIPTYDERGFVSSKMPKVAHLWPDAVRSNSAEKVKKWGGTEESYVAASNEVTKKHEAGHVYLEKLFPREGLPTNLHIRTVVDTGKLTDPPENASMNISFSMTKDQVHEMYGTALELATTNDVRVALSFIEVAPARYQLAAYFFGMYFAKFISQDDFDRVLKANFEDGFMLDPEKMTEYLIQSQNVELINKVGKAMCDEAMKAFEAAAK